MPILENKHLFILILMNNKAAKKLRRLSVALAAGAGKTFDDAERIYKNLKTVYKENKKAPKNRGL